jgi:hypothetical protein
MRRVMVGDTYGRLTVIERVENNRSGQQGKAKLWECRCECGGTKEVISAELTRPNRGVKSCGCLMIEAVKAANTKHGGREESLYITWKNIKARTTNSNHKSYADYGNRGIKMCDEWMNDFDAFRAYVSKLANFDKAFVNGQEKTSIDRIDFDGNYEPDNVRWSTSREQAENRRSTKWIIFEEIKATESQWCKRLGLETGGITKRLRAGWSLENSLTMPALPRELRKEDFT